MSRNKKIQIIKITISLLALLFITFVYLGFYSKIKFLSEQIGNAERSIAILEEKRHDLDNAILDLEEFKDEITVIENSFLSEENFTVFINILEDFSRKSSAKFVAKEVNFPSDESNPAEFSFSLSGDFKNIFRFLYLLDNSQYSGILRKISLHRDGEESNIFMANIDYLIFNFRL